MEITISIGRGHNDSKWLTTISRQIIWVKKTTLFPEFVNSTLCFYRVIGRKKFIVHIFVNNSIALNLGCVGIKDIIYISLVQILYVLEPWLYFIALLLLVKGNIEIKDI